MSKYAAFHQTYQRRVRNLVSDVEVSSPYVVGEKITIRALWDTGATDTVITPYIAQTLSLTPVDRRKVSGVNSVRWSDVTRISILLPNGVSFGKKRALVCSLSPGINMLIGMDIIMLGDFSISNGADEKTLFSFVIPSFTDKIDLFENAILINKG
jgi:hypothetical protein